MEEKTPPIKGIYWLSEEEYKKAIGQLRLQFNGIFEPFHRPGSDTVTSSIVGMTLTPMIEELLKLAEDYGLRVRGVNKVISLDIIRRDKSYDRAKTVSQELSKFRFKRTGDLCPDCNQELIIQEGCNLCPNCGYTKC